MGKKFLLEIKGGIDMLYEIIYRAQNGDKEAMQELVDRFTPLMRKRASKLGYEDAYEDIRLFFIELIYFMKLEKIRLKEDGGITSYINASVNNFYNKETRKSDKWRREIVVSALPAEQRYYVEKMLSKEDRVNIFNELNIKEMLAANEYETIYLIYIEGYSVAEVARRANKTRQAVNQLKKRVLKKIKDMMFTF